MFRTDARTMERRLMRNVYDKTEEDEVPLEPYGLRSGDTIFHCETCMTQRKYGNGKPDEGRERVMLLCIQCRMHTWHKFIKIY